LALDYILSIFTRVVEGLQVFPDRMYANIESSRGLVFSQRTLLELVDKGLSREEAYKIVQTNATRCWAEMDLPSGCDFRELLKSDPIVSTYLSESEMANLFDYGYYTRYVDNTFQRLGLQASPVGSAV
jgi:adenylosuccinate lyase